MFYPSAKIIIKHPSDRNKILLVKRYVDNKIFYEPCGGKVEIDYDKKKAESLEECVVREALEELGLLVKIEKYIGSYYFFWTIDKNKCSSCALFVGNIVGEDANFTDNADQCELPIEPEWVTIEDIVNKKIRFNKSHIGLENLIMNNL